MPDYVSNRPAMGARPNRNEITNSPWRTGQIGKPRPKPSSPKHDGLCTRTYAEAHTKVSTGRKVLDLPPTPGQTPRNCWCLCPQCWDPLRRVPTCRK